MSEFKIDKGVPVASHQSRNGKYPWREMEVGDSFFVAGKTPEGMCSCYKRAAPKRFVCRTVIENGVKGVRVWRVA